MFSPQLGVANGVPERMRMLGAFLSLDNAWLMGITRRLLRVSALPNLPGVSFGHLAAAAYEANRLHRNARISPILRSIQNGGEGNRTARFCEPGQQLLTGAGSRNVCCFVGSRSPILYHERDCLRDTRYQPQFRVPLQRCPGTSRFDRLYSADGQVIASHPTRATVPRNACLTKPRRMPRLVGQRLRLTLQFLHR